MSDQIEPVVKPVEPEGGFTFPNHPVYPPTVEFKPETSPRRTAGFGIVLALVGSILAAEVGAYAFTKGWVSLPSLPNISWPDRREVTTPPTPQEPAKLVDVKAELIELVSEHIRVTRQIAFEASKTPAGSTTVLEKRRDEIKISIRALAARVPSAELPPEVKRFIQAM